MQKIVLLTIMSTKWDEKNSRLVIAIIRSNYHDAFPNRSTADFQENASDECTNNSRNMNHTSWYDNWGICLTSTANISILCPWGYCTDFATGPLVWSKPSLHVWKLLLLIYSTSCPLLSVSKPSPLDTALRRTLHIKHTLKRKNRM